MQPNLSDRLLVTLQRLIPARLIARFVYWLSRHEGVLLKNALIRGFSRLYAVDTDEAALPVPAGYASFNAFFTRALRAGARPVSDAPGALVSPVDGTVAQAGTALRGQLIQAKGKVFSARRLLGDAGLADQLADAPFATVYLAPYNYHRVHMPCRGRLAGTIYIPGRLYSVNARTTAAVDDLYAVNERLVCHFEGDRGPFALVLVGAMNVASISTAWSGELPVAASHAAPPVLQRYGTDGPVLERGAYMGHFNLGSTIVLLGPAAAIKWQPNMIPGATVRTGEVIGLPGSRG